MSLPSKPGRTRRAAFLLTLAALPVSALASDQNENKRAKEKTEAGTGGTEGGEGQLRQTGSADLASRTARVVISRQRRAERT